MCYKFLPIFFFFSFLLLFITNLKPEDTPNFYLIPATSCLAVHITKHILTFYLQPAVTVPVPACSRWSTTVTILRE